MRNFKIKLQDNNNKKEIREFDAFDVFDSSLDKIERPGVFKLLLIKEIERYITNDCKAEEVETEEATVYGKVSTGCYEQGIILQEVVNLTDCIAIVEGKDFMCIIGEDDMREIVKNALYVYEMTREVVIRC